MLESCGPISGWALHRAYSLQNRNVYDVLRLGSVQWRGSGSSSNESDAVALVRLCKHRKVTKTARWGPQSVALVEVASDVGILNLFVHRVRTREAVLPTHHAGTIEDDSASRFCRPLTSESVLANGVNPWHCWQYFPTWCSVLQRRIKTHWGC